MDQADVLAFARGHRYGVVGTVSPDGSPQSAFVGIAVTDRFEIVFDTLESSRKGRNLAVDSRASLVIGGSANDDEKTIQLEGVVDRPQGRVLTTLTETYYGVFADGRERLSWPGLVYFRLRPTWLRWSDFTTAPPVITVFAAGAPGQLLRPVPG